MRTPGVLRGTSTVESSGSRPHPDLISQEPEDFTPRICGSRGPPLPAVHDIAVAVPGYRRGDVRGVARCHIGSVIEKPDRMVPSRSGSSHCRLLPRSREGAAIPYCRCRETGSSWPPARLPGCGQSAPRSGRSPDWRSPIAPEEIAQTQRLSSLLQLGHDRRRGIRLAVFYQLRALPVITGLARDHEMIHEMRDPVKVIPGTASSSNSTLPFLAGHLMSRQDISTSSRKARRCPRKLTSADFRPAHRARNTRDSSQDGDREPPPVSAQRDGAVPVRSTARGSLCQLGRRPLARQPAAGGVRDPEPPQAPACRCHPSCPAPCGTGES